MAELLRHLRERRADLADPLLDAPHETARRAVAEGGRRSVVMWRAAMSAGDPVAGVSDFAGQPLGPEALAR